MNIGERIKYLRNKNDATLEVVGKAIGVSRQTLQRYESGVIGNIPSDKIEKLAEIFNVSPAYLMGWEDKEQISDSISADEEIITIAAHAVGDLSEESIKKIIEYAKFIKSQENHSK